MKMTLVDILETNPIIAAVKNEEGLEKALLSRSDIVFILFGNLCNISSIVQSIHDVGKYAIVHIDLIEGIALKEIVVDFIKNTAKADGIISTRAPILRAAKSKNLYTIHRFFLIDSLSFHNLPKQHAASLADVIEIMPGCVIPKVFKWVQEMIKVPIISSGLICEKEDAIAALRAGAIAISTTSDEVWSAI